ncbi:FMN-binding protein [Bacillus altitudinis]|uniref:FMN-binding protein n=1 Tax=Bacillus altitudinis TaxID=293387 RepID=UPI00247FFB35|nr:FMN-binding protein [Bacillus altitudinis]MEE3606844.1 FMN-binding protein [Bacillus altitudinis]MEE3613093.1 FMN-binding protein [Bacillus altitudinis]MEE3648276.1 FMN-binding protein [Bacillus altitudinis]MEE4393004.1 FMN-binding protein [Bacillus altitudinis]MEE4396729.1 FMN-binding protein [Bacillus altitudinis]
MAKINKKMISLCTAAISSLYITGYATTHHAQAVQTAQSNTQTDASNHTSLTSDTTATQTEDTTSETELKDGTFSGTGSNEIGSISVSVTIKQGNITSVAITSDNTRYGQSSISSLPNEVVIRQSADVDTVSGATLSTQDFETAVAQALEQAKA